MPPARTYPDVTSMHILPVHILLGMDGTHEVTEEHKAICGIPTRLLDLHILK